MKLVDDSFDEVNEKSTNNEGYSKEGVRMMASLICAAWAMRIWQRN